MFDRGALLMVIGSGIFLVGAALGVPSVFTTSDRSKRLHLLERHRLRWQLAQVPYAAGPVLAAVGVGVAGLAVDGWPGALWGVGGLGMLIGSLAWTYTCMLRAVDPVDFVLGGQPGWPFTTYVVLTIVGIFLLGLSVNGSGGPIWTAWVVMIADAGFLAGFAITHDIPPFVFYLLLLLVGLTV